MYKPTLEKILMFVSDNIPEQKGDLDDIAITIDHMNGHRFFQGEINESEMDEFIEFTSQIEKQIYLKCGVLSEHAFFEILKNDNEHNSKKLLEQFGYEELQEKLNSGKLMGQSELSDVNYGSIEFNGDNSYIINDIKLPKIITFDELCKLYLVRSGMLGNS